MVPARLKGSVRNVERNHNGQTASTDALNVVKHTLIGQQDRQLCMIKANSSLKAFDVKEGRYNILLFGVLQNLI
jgi:hypothetical protein